MCGLDNRPSVDVLSIPPAEARGFSHGFVKIPRLNNLVNRGQRLEKSPIIPKGCDRS